MAPLLDLLDSPDPAVREQAVELARAMGDAGIEAVLSGFVLDGDGRLWSPERPAEVAVQLLADSDHPWRHRTARLSLPSAPEALIARLGRFPALVDLDLPGVRLTAPLPPLPALHTLRLSGATIEEAGFAARLPALADLDLSDARSVDLDLTGLRALRRVSLEGSAALKSPPLDVALPPTVTDLNANGVVRIAGLFDLPLTTLHARGFQAQRWPRLDALTVLEVHTHDLDTVTTLPLTALSVTGLRSRDDLAPLAGQDRLASLSLTSADVSPRLRGWEVLRGLPALRVIDVRPALLWAEAVCAPGWVCPPQPLQRELIRPTGVSAHPVRDPGHLARMKAHWIAEGYRHRLEARAPIERWIMVVKGLRRASGLGLGRCRVVVEGIRAGGFPCLTLPEALRFQRWLLACDTPTRIQPWR